MTILELSVIIFGLALEAKMKEERRKILEMLEAGKINAEEAARLLEALGDTGEAPRTNKNARYLRIYVENPDEETKINIKLPVGLVRAASRFIPKDAKATINGMDMDLEQLLSAIDEETDGEIVNITGEDGEVVIIKVE